MLMNQRGSANPQRVALALVRLALGGAALVARVTRRSAADIEAAGSAGGWCWARSAQNMAMKFS